MIGLVKLVTRFGAGKLAVGGLLSLTLAWGAMGWASVYAARIEAQQAQFSELGAMSELAQCGADLKNVLEAWDRNASIPQNLSDFAVPDNWLRPIPSGAPAAGAGATAGQ